MNAPADEVTVLVCGAGHTSTKTIVAREGEAPEIRGFNAGMFFRILRRPASNIRELSALLFAMEALPNVLVIRGSVKPNIDSSRALRRNKATFATPAQGRRWILVDFDKIALPAGLSMTTDSRAVAEHLVSQLPEEFHDVTYHYQLSSSAGIRAGDVASMHAWFWLSRPHPDKELKRWAKQVNASVNARLVDPLLFNDVQPHYVAVPVFVGMDDPLPARSALVVKAKDEVKLRMVDDSREDESFTPVDRDPGNPSLGFEAILAQIGDHPNGEGFHEPIIRAVASYVASHGRSGTDFEWLFATVRARVLSADRSKHDDDAYIEHMASREHIIPAIEGALEKYGDPDPRRRAKVIPGLAAEQSGNQEDDAATARARLDEALSSIVKARNDGKDH